jgi:(p)ppGpp synthase/HD superfamily hydrolase
LERAISIAAEAHAGQVDKAGAPYVPHPLRMMLRMSSTDARIVAVLRYAALPLHPVTNFRQITPIGVGSKLDADSHCIIVES